MRAHLLKTTIVWAAIAASSPLLMSTAHAQAARYELDPDHTTVAFLVDHIGYAKVLGMFRSARGSFKRSAYGMNYAVANGWVGDEVPLIIELEAIRK
ncbi:MAG: hypothetical protein U1E02_36020 [Hydrogenophaga sp.]|nr:hypothetical protein [Hydrogenophaga sp.]